MKLENSEPAEEGRQKEKRAEEEESKGRGWSQETKEMPSSGHGAQRIPEKLEGDKCVFCTTFPPQA